MRALKDISKLPLSDRTHSDWFQFTLAGEMKSLRRHVNEGKLGPHYLRPVWAKMAPYNVGRIEGLILAITLPVLCSPEWEELEYLAVGAKNEAKFLLGAYSLRGVPPSPNPCSEIYLP